MLIMSQLYNNLVNINKCSSIKICKSNEIIAYVPEGAIILGKYNNEINAKQVMKIIEGYYNSNNNDLIFKMPEMNDDK